MAQYSVLFGGDTIGNPPSGFTARWVTTNSSWLVQSDVTSEAGKLLRHTATADGRRLLSLDSVDVDANRDNVELLFRFASTSTSNNQGLCAFRASGAAASENAYRVTLTSTQIQLRKFLAGVDSSVSSVSFSAGTTLKYYCRVRANGTTLQIRIWSADTIEPGSWNISVTDSNISGVGWVGFSAEESTGNRDFDFLSVATNGDTAAYPTDGTGRPRATQAATLILDGSDADARLTQAAILYLEGGMVPVGDARATQAAILYLTKEEVGARISQAAILALVHETPCATQRAQVWKITRTDGQKFTFTTHDQSITWRGDVYKRCDSLMVSASSGGLADQGAGDVQVRGLISDSSITERDLIGGLFDGATVEVWVLQWGNLEQGFIPFRIIKGILGKISQSEVSFTAEMLTPGAKLQQRPLLQTYTPACRWTLGEAPCPVDLGALRVAGSVTGLAARDVRTRNRFRVFNDTARVEADGYFTDGVLTWTSGNNVGLMSEVKTNASGWITLWVSMPREINPGDAYTIVPGCNKTKTDHTTKFGLDMVTFGGFPDLPGTDAMLQTPNAK